MRWPREPSPPDPALIAFGRVVQAWRRRVWMTQREFGIKVGLDQGSVSKLERGLLPGIRLKRLVAVLDLIAWLDPRRAPPKPTSPSTDTS